MTPHTSKQSHDSTRHVTRALREGAFTLIHGARLAQW